MKTISVFFLFPFSILLATVPAFSANLGDFQTKASGNWNQITIWQYYNGASWVNASWAPTYTDGQIDVLSGYSVTVTAGLSIDQTDIHGTMVVNSGITLTVNDGSSTDMAIYNPVTVNGTVVNKGTITGIASEFIFNDGSSYQHNKNGGSLPDATWNDGSTCEITGVTSSTSISNVDQSFYHFKWNCTLQTAETNCAGNLQTIQGDFLMVSSGSSGKLKLGESADYTLTIDGNWYHQGGTLTMGGGSSWAFIILLGNFTMSGGKITEANTAGYTARISFSKVGIQNYVKTSGTFENNVDFEITSGTTLDMGDYIVDGSLGLFSVNSGATLKTSNTNGIANSGAIGCIQTNSRYYSIAANYQFCRIGAQATGNGIPSPLNGRLAIGSPTSATNLTITNGSITINGTLVLCSSTLVNSTIPSGTVGYGSNGTLEYQGMSAQTTTIKEWPTTAAPVHVTINNGSGVILDNNRTITGNFTLTLGSFSIGAHPLTLTGALVKTSGTLSGGSTSNITIGGSSVTALDLPDVTLSTLILNRASGVRLTGNVTIYDTMTMTNGVVTLMPSKALSYLSGSRLKYNGSSSQTTGAEEFPSVNGPPALEVDKSGGSALNLNFSRTLVENLYLTNGCLSIGSNTLTLNGLITCLSGTVTGGSSSNIIFEGSGVAATLPAVTLNNLTINRSQGIYLGGNVNIQGTLYLTQGSLYLQANTLTVNGSVNQTSGNLSGINSSTLIFGPAPASTYLPAIFVGYLEINRGAGILMDGDVQVEHNLTLTSGSLSIGSYILTLNGSLTLSGGELSGGPTSNLVISGFTPVLSLPAITLGNLTLSRPAGLTFTGDILVENYLTLNSGMCGINGQLLTLNGSIQYSGGTLTGGPTSALNVGGSGSTLNLDTITLQNLVLNRGNGLSLSGNVEVQSLFSLMGGNLSRNGFSIYGPATTLCYQGSIPQTTTNEEFPETDGPCGLQIQNSAGVTLHADRLIPGNIQLLLGPLYLDNHTLTLNGTFSYTTGYLQGSASSNIVFAPGPAAAELPAVELNNLTINRTPGVTLNGFCTLYGTLFLTNGDFMVGLNHTLNLQGYPIAGNPLNLKTNNQSRLLFGSTQPGFIIPASVTKLGRLTVSNPSGVSLQADLIVQSGTVVTQRFIMNDHVVSGSGSFALLPFAQLVIGHPAGVAGNIQITGPLILDSNADFEFNGDKDQLTNFLPTSTPNTIRNLTISNNEPNNVTLNSDMTLTGNLDILSGAKFTIDPPYTLTVETDVVLY